MSEDFFESRQAAALLKHQLLGRYIRVFVNKVGSTSAGHRVCYLDGFAGPGLYDDGSPGSPAVVAEAMGFVSEIRDVDAIFVEQDREFYLKLSELLADVAPSARCIHADVEAVLPSILDSARGVPLFAFLDPFGLNVPFESVRSILARQGTTEVLLNVSLPGIRRNAGHLTSVAKDERYQQARATILTRMDSSLGGDWWREIWIEEDEAIRTETIAREYVRRCGALTGSYYDVAVSDSWQGRPSYLLLLLTRHADGFWHFNEALSKAMEVYREYCLAQEQQLHLETPESRARQWQDHIAANIEDLLRTRGAFTIGDLPVQVYGDALGLAREMHVRAAIKSLHKRGLTTTSGVGRVQGMRIDPAD